MCYENRYQKAYDTLKWNFLKNTLRMFGFHSKMICWIMACVSTPSYYICINRERHRFFKGGRVLTQGDPLSPYLFTLLVEVFNLIFIKKISKDKRFKYHFACKGFKITHLCFANDLIVLCHGDVHSVNVVKEVLDTCSKLSGLHPHLSKSTLFCGSMDRMTIDAILNILPFKSGKFPVRYLGVPLVAKKIGVKDYKGLIDKVKARIIDWKNNNLSYAGSTQLIASVLSSIQVYWASVFKFPKIVITDIEKLFKGFLWNKGDVQREKLSLVTLDNTTNELLNKLLQQLGNMHVNTTNVANNSPNPTVAFATGPPWFTAPNNSLVAGPLGFATGPPGFSHSVPYASPTASYHHPGPIAAYPTQQAPTKQAHTNVLHQHTGDLYPVTTASLIPHAFLFKCEIKSFQWDHGGEFDNHDTFDLNPTFPNPTLTTPTIGQTYPLSHQQHPTEPAAQPTHGFPSLAQLYLPVQQPSPVAQHTPVQLQFSPTTIPHQTIKVSDQHAPAIVKNPLVNPSPDSVHFMVTRFRVRTNRPTEHFNLHVSSVSSLPKSYRDAFNDPNWQNAMRDEYTVLINNKTWIVVPRLSDTNNVRCMWLFRHKYLADGTLSHYKARLVKNGSTHRTHIDTESKPGSDGDPVSDPTLYRSLACSLSYLTFNRPNISYAVQQRQPTLSRSSVEAEYRGVANAVAETCWLDNLLRELHTSLSSVTLVYYDISSLPAIDSFLSRREIYATGFSNDAYVADCINDNNWMCLEDWILKYPALNQYLVPSLNKDMKDKLLWKSNNGSLREFANSHVWNDMRVLNGRFHCWNVIWFSQNVPRHAFVLWMVVKKKLITQDKLAEWKPGRKCPFCKKVEDSHNHLFFYCDYSKEIWMEVQKLTNEQYLFDLDGCIPKVSNLPCKNSIWSIVRILCIANTVYHIWQEKNTRLFQQKTRNSKVLL
nr:RNA-directed DNA polymerase, eukaryota, reverse transcriptase zinc-binding domain protein [Tanacetum cinerariifolium]